MRNSTPNPPADRKGPDARCPRCGYDQRGVIESWTEASPLNGVCAECGLEFEWGELLSPARNVPRWCVEYARRRGILWASFQTLGRLLVRPDRFWRDLKMNHSPRWLRLPLVLLPAAVILYLVLAVSVGADTYRHFSWAKSIGVVLPFPPELVALYAVAYPNSRYRVGYPQSLLPPPGARFRGPTATQRPRNYLWRKLRKFDDLLGDNRRAVRGGSFLLPLGRRPLGRLSLNVVLVHVFLMALLCPLSFLGLPQSLRKAKVRLSHILRIWFYSVFVLVWPVAFILLSPIGPNILWRWWGDGQDYLVYFSALTGLIIWWSLASKHYLKLPHAWGVGASVVVLGYASILFVIVLGDYLVFLMNA